MNWTGLIITLSSIIVVIVGVIIYASRAQYKYKFKIWSRDFKNCIEKKAKIVKDKEDPRIKMFDIKGLSQYMYLHDPTSYENGKPVRDITTDGAGQYVYIEGSKLNEEKYRESSLEPYERSLIISQLIDNQRKNPVLDKTGLIAQIAWIILAVIALVGIIITVVKFSSMGKTLVDVSEQQKIVSNNLVQIERIKQEYSKDLTVNDDGSLSRALKPDDQAAVS